MSMIDGVDGSTKRSYPMTSAEFLALSPWQRGYAVYMMGERDDEPNVPDESCPYCVDTAQAEEWHEGQRMAVLDAQDGDDG